MANSMRAALVNRLAYRLRAISFSGMAGTRHVVAPGVSEGRRVDGCRVPCLATGEVEANHSSARV